MMEIKNLERALQLSSDKELRRTWRCPDELGLAEYVDGKSPKNRTKRIEKHISKCEFCLHQVALLLALANGETPQVPRELLERAEALVEGAPVRVIPKLSWKWALPAATVATGILLVTLIWVGVPSRWENQQPADSTDYQTVRGGEGEIAELTIKSPSDGAFLTQETLRFEWVVQENALFYEVDVVDLEGNPTWSARVDTSETVVPSSVTLPPGQYFVVVRAIIADGRLISSKFVQFTLR